MGAYADAVLADGPALYWKLNDASGLPQDASGNGRHAEVATGLAYQQAGVGQPLNPSNDGQYSVVLDAGDLIRRDTLTGLDAVDNLGVECWWKNGFDADGIVWSVGDALFTAGGYYLLYDAVTNKVRLIRISDGGTLITSDVATFNDSTWRHIFVRRSGGTWTMWVDGVVQAGTSALAPSAPTQEISIGKFEDGTTFQKASAGIAHFGMYQTVLSDERIQLHALGGAIQGLGGVGGYLAAVM